MITPHIMKHFKRIIPFMMAAALTCTSLPMVAKADGSKVVTLGANLTEEQIKSMYEYFGTTADKVDTIVVTNADERKYMEGIASEAQIGTRTFSCSYVEPTTSGGIQVKVGNLTFVTSSMIASTLLTSGVENCNVVAASPIEVSGTGALTGIMMAYEKATGNTLSEEQKAAATEELVTTGELADSIGQEDATDLMNEVKQEVIKEGLTDEDEIQDAIDDAAKTYNITLTDEQMAKIASLMQNISQYDYDVKALEKTLDNLEGKINDGGFFSNLWNSIKNVFTGGDDNDGGILNETNDDVLGDDAITDNTLEASGDDSEDEEEGGFWDKIVGFFKGIFGGGEEETDTETTDEEETDADAKDNEDEEDLEDKNTDNAAEPDSAVDSTDGSDPAVTSDGTSINGQSSDAASVNGTDNENTNDQSAGDNAGSTDSGTDNTQ